MPSMNRVIEPLIKKAKQENGGVPIVFGDIFTGTGYVSNYYKNHDCVAKVATCDLELYSYVLAKALLTTVCSNKLTRIINYFNSTKLKPVKGLIWKHFSLAGGRMFFTEENAMRIDAMRIGIDRLFNTGLINYKELLFLLASLMCACSRYANVASCFRAYLKKFCPRSMKRIEIQPIHKNMTRALKKHYIMKGDACKLPSRQRIDVAYLDPPYNANHYGGYYSFYNYLLKYQASYEIGGVAGVTKVYNKSNFGFKATAKRTLGLLVKRLRENKTRYIIMSYNSDGVLSKNEIIDCLRSAGDVILHKSINKKFRPSDRVKNKNVTEYLFVCTVTGNGNGKVQEKWTCS